MPNLGKTNTKIFVWRLLLDQESNWKLLHSSQPACINLWVNKGCDKNNVRCLSKAVLNLDRRGHGLFLLFCTISHLANQSAHCVDVSLFLWKPIIYHELNACIQLFLLPSQAKVTCNMLQCFFSVTIRLQPRAHTTQRPNLSLVA